MLIADAIDRLAKGSYKGLAGSTVEVPERFNWVEEIFEGIHTRRDPDRIALLWTAQDGNEKRFTFGEFAARGNKLLNLFREKGLRKGDPVFVMLPSLPEVWFSYFTSIKGGFVMIPAANLLTAEDISYRFRQYPPSAVLADGASAERIDVAEARIGRRTPVKVLIGGGASRDGWIDPEQIDGQSDDAEPERTRSDDRLLIFFTSGTAGLPKMVVHTQASYPLGHLTTAEWLGVKPNDVHYNISQPGWAKFAWSSFFSPFLMGATVLGHHYAGRFVAKEHLNLIERHHVTTFCAPPTVWRILILEDIPAYRFKHLREVMSAGEPLNPEVIMAWKSSTGLTIRDGYGQTESTLMVGNLPGSDVKLGSMGKPLSPYDVRIVDEGGTELPPNEEGNIAISLRPKPTGLFVGYIGADDERMAMAFRGGLYYTGDRAYKDNEGRVWFVGRADDVIKASDYRIGPFEVESILMEHPAVAETAVVGSPHATRGNVVKAFVILKSEYASSGELADEIFQFAKERLAPYKVPRLIEFTPELPKTISGKIRRLELRASEVESKHNGESREHEYQIRVTGRSPQGQQQR